MYTVLLENTGTGERVTVEMSGQYDQVQQYMWEEGKYADDECRRCMFNLELLKKGVFGSSQRVDSGGTIYKAVSVTEDGVITELDE